MNGTYRQTEYRSPIIIACFLRIKVVPFCFVEFSTQHAAAFGVLLHKDTKTHMNSEPGIPS